MNGQQADDLRAGYETLRAAATGAAVPDTPRGLALFLTQGLPGWMAAWAPPPPSVPAGLPGERPLPADLGVEMVGLLTEMALGCRSALAAS
ncbi:MAG: hypothetical protein ACRDKL_00080 [Solirubrobacteraceae bacterium]